jgi:hypothetical protein
MLWNRMMMMSNRRFTLVLKETDLRWWDKVQEGLEELELGGRQVEILRSDNMMELRM